MVMPRRRLPPLNSLRAFEAAARQGRRDVAAEELCLTHDAVGRHIAKHEEFLGTKLFDRRRLFMLGNRLWHSDSSYKRIPAKYSLLSAHVVPPEGGETEFADMRAAWDALSDWKKDQVRNLICEHSRLYSKGALGFDFSEEEKTAFAPVQQRLVRRHAGSNRLALFLSSHIGAIVGMARPEALMLLRDLTEHATQREFVYAHKWKAGDLVMWDNRCTMHRGRDYDDAKYPRDLRRTTLTDSACTLEQAA